MDEADIQQFADLISAMHTLVGAARVLGWAADPQFEAGDRWLIQPSATVVRPDVSDYTEPGPSLSVDVNPRS